VVSTSTIEQGLRERSTVVSTSTIERACGSGPRW
jgi:hypothetical protein